MIFNISKTKLLKDFTIIILITFGMLASFEGVLRAIYSKKHQDTGETKNLGAAYQFNKDVLIQLKPNISKTFARSKKNGGNTIHWKTNKDSFRGAELADNPKHRIIVYGDSNIQARFTDRENTYTSQLDHYLRKKGKQGVEIINAGLIGAGPDQSLIRFIKDADKYKPDVVIFHVFADNDFGDLVRNRLFNVEPNGNVVRTNNVATVDEILQKKKALNNTERVKEYILKSYTVKALNKILSVFSNKENQRIQLIPQLQQAAKEEYLIYKESKPRKLSHFADHYDIDVALNPEQESSVAKIKLMNGVLKKASDFANEKGIKFVVLIQPSVIDSTTDNAILGYEYLKKYKGYQSTNLTGEVEKICLVNQINYINLFDVFLKEGADKLFFTGGNDHWSDQGQKIAAEQTARYIINRSLIESR